MHSDFSLNSTSKISNFKLLVHPIEQDIPYFEQDMSGQNKSVRDRELVSRKAEHLSITDGIFWSMYFNQR